jgi:hypothetical protein
MLAALLAGAVARADETPPQSPVPAPPPTAVQGREQGPAQAPPQSPVQAPPPAVVQGPEESPAQVPSQSPVQAPPPVAVQTSPPAPVQPPPKSAVQSVPPEDAEAILGQRVTDQEGKEIGRLVDVLVDTNGQPQAAVIDFGGFMGVGNRKVAVHWSVLHFNPGDAKHKITLEMTPDQIKAAPEFLNPNKAASVVTPTDTAPTSP